MSYIERTSFIELEPVTFFLTESSIFSSDDEYEYIIPVADFTTMSLEIYDGETKVGLSTYQNVIENVSGVTSPAITGRVRPYDGVTSLFLNIDGLDSIFSLEFRYLKTNYIPTRFTNYGGVPPEGMDIFGDCEIIPTQTNQRIPYLTFGVFGNYVYGMVNYSFLLGSQDNYPLSLVQPYLGRVMFYRIACRATNLIVGNTYTFTYHRSVSSNVDYLGILDNHIVSFTAEQENASFSISDFISDTTVGLNNGTWFVRSDAVTPENIGGIGFEYDIITNDDYTTGENDLIVKFINGNTPYKENEIFYSGSRLQVDNNGFCRLVR